MFEPTDISIPIAQLEKVLNFGLFRHNYLDGSNQWSEGIYLILGIEKMPAIDGDGFLLGYIETADALRIQEKLLFLKQTGEAFETEFSVTDAQAGSKRLYAKFCNDYNSSGVIVGYTAIVKDITESYTFKKELEDKITQLDASNKNLQEFVYVASHDLQEPVRKVLTFTERLAVKCNEHIGLEGKMYLERVQNSANNMQTLLNDLLGFSRLSFSEKIIERIDLNACLKQAISGLEVQIEESNAKIVSVELPIIEGYSTQLNQLFSNLLSNSIKFRKQTTTPEIVIKYNTINSSLFPHYNLMTQTPYCMIEVIDNGIGFESEYSEQIFLMFQRLNSKSEYPGSGVGLAICKKVTENHRGVIFANSSIHHGSTFTLLLPYSLK